MFRNNMKNNNKNKDNFKDKYFKNKKSWELFKKRKKG